MEHWKLLEINSGRWFINNIITLSSESSDATSGAHCIRTFVTQYACICVVVIFCRNSLNTKVKATRSTVLTILD